MKWSIKTINKWLILLLSLFGMIYGFDFIRSNTNLIPNNIHYLYNARPTINLLGIETLDAISLFRGDEPKGFEVNNTTVAVLFNIILFFLIGPYLLYLGYKNEKKRKLNPWYWFIGVMICIGSLNIIPTSLISIKVFENTKESAEESRIKDLMRQELMDVGFATAEFMILNNSERSSFSLNDIEIQVYEFQYAINGEPTDSLVTITCSNSENTSYSLVLDVSPDKKELVRMRN